jgi:hypothetical protein
MNFFVYGWSQRPFDPSPPMSVFVVLSISLKLSVRHKSVDKREINEKIKSSLISPI